MTFNIQVINFKYSVVRLRLVGGFERIANDYGKQLAHLQTIWFFHVAAERAQLCCLFTRESPYRVSSEQAVLTPCGWTQSAIYYRLIATLKGKFLIV